MRRRRPAAAPGPRQPEPVVDERHVKPTAVEADVPFASASAASTRWSWLRSSAGLRMKYWRTGRLRRPVRRFDADEKVYVRRAKGSRLDVDESGPRRLQVEERLVQSRKQRRGRAGCSMAGEVGLLGQGVTGGGNPGCAVKA